MIYIAWLGIYYAAKFYSIPGFCHETWMREANDCTIFPPGSIGRAVCQAQAQGRYEACILNNGNLLTGCPPTVAPPADFNNDGGVDGADVEAFMEAWAAGYYNDCERLAWVDGWVQG